MPQVKWRSIMIVEELERKLAMQCPKIVGTEHLFTGKKEVYLAQANFFKSHKYVFQLLNERYAKVLKLHFGVDCKPLNFDDISNMFGVSRQRIYQIEEKAFTNLRKPQILQLLANYTDETISNDLIDRAKKKPNYGSLIFRDVINTMSQDKLKIIEDISVDKLSINFGRGPDEKQELKNRLHNLGIHNCSQIIEHIKANGNLEEWGIGYHGQRAIIFSICQLIDNGKVVITSKESTESYKNLKSKQNQQRQEEVNLIKAREQVARQITLNAKNDKAKRLREAMYFPENVRIEDLNFTPRVNHYLIDNGIRTLKQLMDFETDFIDIRNLGVGSVQEIYNKVNLLGIDLEGYRRVRKAEKILQKIQNPETLNIAELGFSKRTYNALKKSGLNTLADIINTNINFKTIQNLGAQSLEEIYKTLKALEIDIDEEKFIK